jgi:L-cystine uptake protein TcyP (sodium:dicarboxylate symporter family)
MSLFTYITGIITFLGFLLQIRDVFPKHREARRVILLLVTGAFFGSIIGSLQATQLVIQTPDHPLLLIAYIAFAALVALLILAAIGFLISESSERRETLSKFIANGFGAAMVLGVALALVSGVTSATRNDISVDDFILISKNRAQQRDFDGAIGMLEKAQSKLSLPDSRIKMLQNEIEAIKKLQIDQLKQ